jgi:hypothetical protein
MPRTDPSLDEQIAEVEGRLAEHRAQLRLLAAEARSRISVSKSVPVAMAAALAVGFAASRFVRRPARPIVARERSRSARMFSALAAALLPPLIRPLQHLATEWIAQRLHRGAAR